MALYLIILSAFILLNSAVNLLPARKSPMENPGLFQGDIKLNPKQKTLLSTENPKWTDGILYYTINTAAFDESQIKLIHDAMRLIETQTSADGKEYVKFVQRTNQENYTFIDNLPGCYSYVGMIGGNQTLSLQAPGCIYIGTIAHELLHALGYAHEQSRPDRDDYVYVNYTNIVPDQTYQFDILEMQYVEAQDLEYDINSIMHYGNYAFSKNDEMTIYALHNKSFVLLEPYDKYKLSESDVIMVRKRYEKPSDCSNAISCFIQEFIDAILKFLREILSFLF